MTDLSVGKKLAPYRPCNKVRLVTAAALFDGHDEARRDKWEWKSAINSQREVCSRNKQMRCAAN